VRIAAQLREDRSVAIVYTVGHSTRTTEELLAILRHHGIALLADVRTLPGSRRAPQFNREALERTLAEAGIAYVHLKGLGGLRKPRSDSENAGWRNASFRGFADYMQTPEFEHALGDLIELAEEKPTAIMCAEAVPWRCHRSLIADALLVRRHEVVHIFSETKTEAHRLTSFARAEGTRVWYPPEQLELRSGGHGAR
jgi:uncharacterized protein (DUF488 family)